MTEGWRKVQAGLIEVAVALRKNGASPSEIAVEFCKLGVGRADIAIVMRQAFNVPIGFAGSVSGWASDGSRELNDEDLDRILLPYFEQWDKTG